MQTINDRYSILEELGESDNSIVYKAFDVLNDREVILKFINRNSGKLFPAELFRKEYIFNRVIVHPLIRKLYGFEYAVIIDGERVVDPDMFIVGEYCDRALSAVTLTLHHKEMLQHALTFLHENEWYHGDLKKDNILVTKEGFIKLTDISPFFDTKFAQKNDIACFRQIIGDVHQSLMPAVTSPEMLDIHTVVLRDHFCGSPIPISQMLTDADIEILINSEKYIVLLSPNDPSNALTVLQGFIPYCEVAGYTVMHCDFSKFDIHRLAASIMDYFYAFDFGKVLITEHGDEYVKCDPLLPFKPSVSLSKPDLELKKNIEFAAYFIEELTKINPLCVFIPQIEDLDPASNELIGLLFERLNVKKFRIVSTTLNSISQQEYFSFEVHPLESDAFSRVMKYYNYFWKLPESVQEQIYSVSGGESIMILEGMHKLGIEHGFEIQGTCIVPEYPVEYYFDRFAITRQLITTLTSREKDIVTLMSTIAECFTQEIIAEVNALQETIEHLSEKNVIYMFHDHYRARALFFNEKIPISKENIVLKPMVDALHNNLFKNRKYLYAFTHLSLIYEAPDTVFAAVYTAYEHFSTLHDSGDFDYYFSVFSLFLPYESFLKKSNVFSLYWILYREDIHSKLEKIHINDKLRQNAVSAEESLKYASFFIEHMPITKDEIAHYYSYFYDPFWLSDDTAQRIVLALLMKMRMMGLYQEAVDQFTSHLSPHLDRIPYAVQLDMLITVFSIYLEKNDYNLAKEIAQKLRQIYEAHIAEIPDNYIVSVYNASAIAARHNKEYDQAIEFYHRSLKAAQAMKHYTNMSVVTNNIGVMWYYKNDYEKYIFYLEQSNEYAERSENIRQYFLTLNNLLNFYDSSCQFTRMRVCIHKGEQKIVHLHEERLIANFYDWKTEFYIVFNDMHKAFDALQQSKKYHCELKKELETSYVFHGRKIIVLAALHGEKEAVKYLRSVERELGKNATPDVLYRWYTFILQWCYYYDFEHLITILAKRVGKIINAHPEMFAEIGSNELLVWHLSLLSDFTTRVPLASVKQQSSRIVYFALLLQHALPKSIAHREYRMQLWACMKELMDSLALEDREQFTHTPFFMKLASLLALYGIAMDKSEFCYYRRIYSQHEVRAVRSRQKDFYKTADALSLVSQDELLEKTMHDIMTLTNADRVIFFTYSAAEGWAYNKEVCDTFWYEKEEKYIDELLFKCLIATKKDEVQFYCAENPRTNEITHAFVIPLIDISQSRKNAKVGTSFTNLFAIRGALYADTKRILAVPEREAVNHTYYLREYVNLSLYYNQLKEAAMTDPLTGLFKRDIWLDMTKDMFKYAKEHKKVVGIVMSDVDHFKAVNDVYGHKKGDAVLREVAGLFLKNIRQFDTAGRYGGEEFIIALSVNDAQEGESVTERLRAMVEKTIAIEGKPVTVSFGIALYPNDGAFINELIEKADKALFTAKETGRNKVVSWQNIGEIQVETSLEKKHAIITNPAREKEKIDLIIELHNEEYYSGTLEEIGKKLTSVCNRFVPIRTVLLLSQKKSRMTVSDSRFPIETTEGFPEYITDTTQRMVSIETHGSTLAVYFEEQVGGIALTLEKNYYTFIGNIIVEKLIRHFSYD